MEPVALYDLYTGWRDSPIEEAVFLMRAPLRVILEHTGSRHEAGRRIVAECSRPGNICTLHNNRLGEVYFVIRPNAPLGITV